MSGSDASVRVESFLWILIMKREANFLNIKKLNMWAHLMGPSLAYSSWILLSDIISLFVLRFLLSEHVSLKLHSGVISSATKAAHSRQLTVGFTHLQPRKRKCSHSQVSTSMMMAMGKLKMNHVPKLITLALG